MSIGRKDKEALVAFLEAAQALVDNYFESIGSPQATLSLTAVPGSRFVKIEAKRASESQIRGVLEARVRKRSSPMDYWTWGFVDLRNGDCLKAGTYKSPTEKTPRGNIRDSFNGIGMVSAFGFKSINHYEGLPKGLRNSC